MKKWIATLLVILMLLPLSVSAAPPLYSQAGLADRVVRFVQNYNQWKAEAANSVNPASPSGESASPADSLEARWNQKLADRLSGKLKANVVDLELFALSDWISKQSNGHSWGYHQLMRVLSLGHDISSREVMTYNDAIADLFADYLANPVNREADLVLLKQISSSVRQQVSEVENASHWEAVVSGTVFTLSVLQLIEFGRTNSGALQQGWKMVVSGFKPGGTGAVVQELVTEAGEAAKKTDANLAKKAMDKLVQTLNQFKSEISSTNLKGVRAQTVQGIRNLSWDLGRSLATGGIAWGLWKMNLQTTPIKLDPMRLLPVIQAQAILDLQSKLELLRTYIKSNYPALIPSHSVTPNEQVITTNWNALLADPEQASVELDKIIKQFEESAQEFEHLNQSADLFRGNIPLTYEAFHLKSGKQGGAASFLIKYERFAEIRGRLGRGEAVSLSPCSDLLVEIQEMIGLVKSGLSDLKSKSPQDLQILRHNLLVTARH